MSDPALRYLIREFGGQFSPEPSSATQALMSVPSGNVQRLRRTFERPIAEHYHEPNSVLIDRVLRNTNELIRQNQFLRDHDNLHRAVLRGIQTARLTHSNLDVDVLTPSCTPDSRTPAARIRMMEFPGLNQELRDCTESLKKEILRILRLLGNHFPLPMLLDDVELENVGPDHNPNDFGREITQNTKLFLVEATTAANTDETIDDDNGDARDPAVRCCICLDPYHVTSHPAFLLYQCKHIVGKPCFTAWLNGTSPNSNTCPHCRAELCERRPRRPKAHTPAITAEIQDHVHRLERVLDLMVDLGELFEEIFGDDMGGQWTDDTIEALNRVLFENTSQWGFMRDGFQDLGWRLGRVDWVRVTEMA
ncbi:Nn.00g049130.m01.CDS01 [Neocucurbitaria sp. VM-36]